MTSKPVLLLVPGSFSTPDLYSTVINATTAKGYEIHGVNLVSVGKKPGLPSMADDAAAIKQTATKFADEGKDVVIIAHSYSGTPTSESIKGISKVEREKEGKKGGVVRVAYMTALVPALGGSSGALMAVAQTPAPEGLMAVDADGWLYQPNPEGSAAMAFNDIPLDEGIAWIKKMSQHSSASFGNELTHAGYKDVPVSYLFCENDKCVPPEVQQKAIDNIEEASGNKVDVTRINTGHCPTVSAPEKVVDWFVGLAEK